jgi:hypothetical protein
MPSASVFARACRAPAPAPPGGAGPRTHRAGWHVALSEINRHLHDFFDLQAFPDVVAEFAGHLISCHDIG